jgi:predicted dithiol-disulfide oxidoreductase (DUF899 family)
MQQKPFLTPAKGARKMSTRNVDNPKAVSQEQWPAASKRLPVKGKQLRRERGAIAGECPQFPQVRVEKNDVFDSPAARKLS